MTTLLTNGRVHAPGAPGATALLVGDDGTVAWLGDAGSAPAADRVLDLQGHWLAPAFVDAHVHTTATGLALTGLDLAGCASLQEALDRLSAYCRGPGGARAVVLGTGWDETSWPEGRPPTAAELDRASGRRSTYLARADVHSAVASTSLLDRCPQAKAAPGWAGEGLVKLAAHHEVRRAALGAVTAGHRAQAQRATLVHAASRGIGSLHEMGGPEISSEQDLAEVIEAAAAHGTHLVAYWGAHPQEAARLGAALGAPVRAGGDLFCDGSLGSRTAALAQPYEASDSCGELLLDAVAVCTHVLAAVELGLQTGFHAIGDRALRAVVDGVAAAADAAGLDRVVAGRHRVEHAEMADTGVIAEMARLGLTASVQPLFDHLWGGRHGMYAARLGPTRAAAMNDWAAMARAGVPLALSSDAPVTVMEPWDTLRAATAHRTPCARLSLAHAFWAATVGGWRAAHEDDAGELRVGSPATMAVWSVPGQSGEPLALPDLSGPRPECLLTMCAGRTTHDAGAIS